MSQQSDGFRLRSDRQEPRMFRGGEVEFRLRPNKDLPPEAYGSRSHWKRQQPQPPLLWRAILLIAVILINFWLASCSHDDMVSVQTSDGKVIREQRKDAESEAVAGGDFPWDFSKLKDPPEPGLPALPPNPEDQRLDARVK